jgi:hypothetical protein
MLCSNGEQKTFPNSTGKFFICQAEIHKNNQCPFSRYCNKTSEYIMTTDKQGNVCPSYIVDKNSI